MPTTLPIRIIAESRGDGVDRVIDRNLLLVLGFCAIGLVTTLNVMLRFPDLGGLIESFNQF